MSSDGPTKVDVALDEIILGEDGAGPEPGPPPPTPLDVPPPKKDSMRAKADPAKKRNKMTLRIPDDVPIEGDYVGESREVRDSLDETKHLVDFLAA